MGSLIRWTCFRSNFCGVNCLIGATMRGVLVVVSDKWLATTPGQRRCCRSLNQNCRVLAPIHILHMLNLTTQQTQAADDVLESQVTPSCRAIDLHCTCRREHLPRRLLGSSRGVTAESLPAGGALHQSNHRAECTCACV